MTTSPATTDATAGPPTTAQASTTTVGPTTTTTTVAAAPPSTTTTTTTTTTVAPASEGDGLVEHRRHYRRSPRRAVGPALTAVAMATGSSGQIRLAWYAPLTNGGLAITDYLIQRSANGVSGWTTIADGVSTATTYTVNGLANGAPYHFRVYARNAIGSSPAGNVTTATPVNALTAPRGVGGGGDQCVASGPPHLDGAAVQRRAGDHRLPHPTITQRVDGMDDDCRRHPRSTTAYTVTGLNDGTRYHFRVYARTSTATSPASTVVNAIPRTKPSAPRSTTAAPTNISGQVRLTWVTPTSNGGSAITDYVIQRSSNGTTWTTIADGVGTATSYTVAGLANGSRYYFRVIVEERCRYRRHQRDRQRGPENRPDCAVASLGPLRPRRLRPRLGRTGPNGRSAITGYILDSSKSGGWRRIGDGFPNDTWDYVGGRVGCVQFRVAATNAAGAGPFSTIKVC